MPVVNSGRPTAVPPPLNCDFWLRLANGRFRLLDQVPLAPVRLVVCKGSMLSSVAATSYYPGTSQQHPAGQLLECVRLSRVAAHHLAERIKRTDGAPVRSAFTVLPNKTAETTSPAPTSAALLRGGRGGEVKLKVELSALWIAVAEPYDVRLPGWAWAELVGLPDPRGRGARRVNAAIRQLAQHELIKSDGGRGIVNELTLLEETGTTQDYTPPGERIDELRRTGQDITDHLYFKVPNGLWTNGWIAALTGRGLAMLLVLLQQTAGAGREDREVWFSPRAAERRLHLSQETIKAGIGDLEQLGLVTVHRRPVTYNPLEPTRLRKTYTLHTTRLTHEEPTHPRELPEAVPTKTPPRRRRRDTKQP